MSSFLNELKELSAEVGTDLSLVQAEGGNTSCKIGEELFLKASGMQLQQAFEKNIFTSMNYYQAKTKLDETLNLGGSHLKLEGKSQLRPSIEAPLHILLPHKFVAHVHALNTICVSIQSRFDRKLDKIASANGWRVVEYEKPGIDLARAVKIELEIFPSSSVFLLRSHGLLVGGGSKAEVIELIRGVEDKLKPFCPSSPTFGNCDMDLLDAICKRSEIFRPCYDPEITKLALLPEKTMKLLEGKVIFPDQAVFLGCGYIICRAHEDIDEAAEIHYLKFKLKAMLVVVPSVGVAVHQDITNSGLQITKFVHDIAVRLSPDHEVRQLSQEQALELVNWEAEKYRSQKAI